MGISTPKKPFNLAEFLAVKAKPQAMRRPARYYRAQPTLDVEQAEVAPSESDATRD